MEIFHMLDQEKLTVSNSPPYDSLQSFVRDNHFALHGAEEGALSDLVFGAKDVFKILGSTWGNGHPEWLRTSPPDEFTTPVISDLLEHGADLVGKTVCDELCFSISGENWNYGHPINPHDPRRLAGGSSSGSCTSTAAGLVDFALGSDCLGSVRVPASYNGVIGMRPTYQRISTEGEAPYCESMDVLGYVAKDPEVFRRVSSLLLGEDEEEFSFSTLLIAEDCFDEINPDVKEALQSAVTFIGDSLDAVESVTLNPDGLDKWVEIFRVIQGYEVWESYGGWIRKYRPRLSPGQKERLEWASTIKLQDYKESFAQKQEIVDRMEDVLKPGTVLVLPTAASVAPLKSAPLSHINETRMQSSALLCISPLAGIPQITLPLATQHGVPLGISLIGPKGSDLELARFGAQLVESFQKQQQLN